MQLVPCLSPTAHRTRFHIAGSNAERLCRILSADDHIRYGSWSPVQVTPTLATDVPWLSRSTEPDEGRDIRAGLLQMKRDDEATLREMEQLRTSSMTDMIHRFMGSDLNRMRVRVRKHQEAVDSMLAHLTANRHHPSWYLQGPGLSRQPEDGELRSYLDLWQEVVGLEVPVNHCHPETNHEAFAGHRLSSLPTSEQNMFIRHKQRSGVYADSRGLYGAPDDHHAMSAAIDRLPRLERPVTVWRGEMYDLSTQHGLDRAREVILSRPGDTLYWDNCMSTSQGLDAATNPLWFASASDPTKMRGLSPTRERTGVLLEIVTDRGIHLDVTKDQTHLTGEDEVLLPAGMAFEVVGHYPVSKSDFRGLVPPGTIGHRVRLKAIDDSEWWD